jgi:hypothetical protein
VADQIRIAMQDVLCRAKILKKKMESQQTWLFARQIVGFSNILTCILSSFSSEFFGGRHRFCGTSIAMMGGTDATEASFGSLVEKHQWFTYSIHKTCVCAHQKIPLISRKHVFVTRKTECKYLLCIARERSIHSTSVEKSHCHAFYQFPLFGIHCVILAWFRV